jgi:homoserine dehydrogenase
VVLITYATNEDAVRRALAAIEREGVVAERPQLIRIEKS